MPGFCDRSRRRGPGDYSSKDGSSDGGASCDDEDSRSTFSISVTWS
jgi:hypothetical protein